MITEADVARAVADWLRSQGWTVYQEVSLDRVLRERHYLGDARADLVGTRGQQVAVVECKLGLSFDLFAQADRWLPFVDLVWIAIPNGHLTDGRRMGFRIAKDLLGCGVLESGDDGVVEKVRPWSHRRRDDALLVSLDPGHQTHGEAGTNHGGQWSPFKETADKLAAYVAANPQCTLEEALTETQHHYRTMADAEARITKAIRKGLVPGVKFGWRQRLEVVR